MRNSRRWLLVIFLFSFTIAYYSGLFGESDSLSAHSLPANNSDGYSSLKSCLWRNFNIPGSDYRIAEKFQRENMVSAINDCVRNSSNIGARDFLTFNGGLGEGSVRYLPPKSSSAPVPREFLNPRKATKPVKIPSECVKLSMGITDGNREKEFALEFPECKIYGLGDNADKDSKDFWNYGSLIPVILGSFQGIAHRNISVPGHITDTRSLDSLADVFSKFVFPKLGKPWTVHFASLRTPNPRSFELLADFLENERKYSTQNPVALCQIDFLFPSRFFELPSFRHSLRTLLFHTGHVPVYAAESIAGISLTIINGEDQNCEDIYAFSKHFSQK